jgi:hypothetical protein
VARLFGVNPVALRGREPSGDPSGGLRSLLQFKTCERAGYASQYYTIDGRNGDGKRNRGGQCQPSRQYAVAHPTLFLDYDLLIIRPTFLLRGQVSGWHFQPSLDPDATTERLEVA